MPVRLAEGAEAKGQGPAGAEAAERVEAVQPEDAAVAVEPPLQVRVVAAHDSSRCTTLGVHAEARVSEVLRRVVADL